MIDNRPLAGGAHLLRVAFPDARHRDPVAQPGQFVQLLAAPSLHLLRRPMSVHDEGDGWRSFMVKPVGPASRELVALGPGDRLDASPPLGRGFAPADELASSPLLLVGGGFGIAPMHFVGRLLDERPRPADYTVLYGGRTARDIDLPVLEGIRGRVLPSTDDGTLGFAGTCVDLALALLREWGPEKAQRTRVLACGSHAMMQALHAGLRGQVARIDVSLEEVMACGVGVCMGCVTPSVRGYVPVCTEGPVFRSEDVFDVPAEVGHV